MKSVAGGLRLDLAAFRELEAFAQLGTELDPATQRQLDRGYRMVELLKQPQYKPMNVVDQLMSIYAGTKGHLDHVPVNEVSRWETDFLNHIHTAHQALFDGINDKQQLDEELEQKLIRAIEDFNEKHGYAKQQVAAAV